MNLAFKIAVRFLKSNKSQTVLIALGIAVGVSVQIFIGSLIQGLQKSLINKTIGNSSQITLYPDATSSLINDYEKIIKKIETENDSITAISPVADNPALIKMNDKNLSVLIRGFDIDAADKIYNIKDRIYQGNPPQTTNDIIVGKDLKENLSINISDTIEVLTNSGENKTFRVTGFFDLKVSSLNKSWLITSIATAQESFHMGDAVTSIEMHVDDVFKADEISNNIGINLADNLQINNWKIQNEELLSGLNGQSISSLMIQVFVLIAVLLGIASVLAVSVVQKSKQLGILKAMGINDKNASLIFLFQGLLLGILGTFLGLILGFALSFMFTKFAVNSDGTPVVDLYINYSFIIISALISIISATIASLIPARTSLKLNPIEVIRNG